MKTTAANGLSSFQSFPQSIPTPLSEALQVSVVNGKELVFSKPSNSSKDKVSLTFHRTLRIPMDGKVYPLPPNLGHFPIKKVDDYLHSVPESWKKHGGVFIPLYQREAMWISFSNASSHYPHAIKIGVGKVNALSGEEWDESMKKRNVQDYCVAPKQPWLDGINNGNGTIRQFVAMPLGEGYTVEGQVTGHEEHGGLQIVCYSADEQKRIRKYGHTLQYERLRLMKSSCASSSCMMEKKKTKKECEMGIAAGGTMKQTIYEDKLGHDFWDESSKARVFVHIVNSEMYKQITGENPPACPISAKTYTQYKYPWYDYYAEGSHIETSSILNNTVKTVSQIDKQKHKWPLQDTTTIAISNVKVIKANEVRDGDW
ncbi:hypothetical protein FDP41_006653 [Naegleria fowleri]|uniref:Uncharacterized protein n=1 Tax=Naegleria fowleri TaxID=5763 RepID=A0A6A5B629_NAEFO|nr:uncharacterized protein FDP41_006653 [Naegleria fowleri]KAF0974043.1 hypothetical protein FDP41_006653 [Naegleria fowleri]CAG4711467.1 unnamed protein product [Naegleria fowleri]